MIKIDYDTYSLTKLKKANKQEISIIKEMLDNHNDMIGWYNTETLFEEKKITDILNTSLYIKNNCDAFVVLGIGGSYMGSKAVIDALSPYYQNQKIKVYYAGYNLSSNYYYDLINEIKNKNIIINVISKSGSTLETSIGYNLLLKLMKQKYSDIELNKRIIVTTTENNSLAYDNQALGRKVFYLPSDVGGRFSVFSPVGLIPISVAGFDITKIIEGAKNAISSFEDCINYAYYRKMMFNNKKIVEAYVTYESKLETLIEWIKQLYGESLGKNNKGILPIGISNTRDLHSMGQFIQSGNKILFETVLNIKEQNINFKLDEYNVSLNEMNDLVLKATNKAHYLGEVSNINFEIEKLDEYNLGYLMQFFMISCAISGFIDNINPFDQPGVEMYKKITKELLNN